MRRRGLDKFFIFVCYISALVLGLILSLILVLTNSQLTPHFFVYLLDFSLFFLLAILIFFSFVSFDIKERNILLTTISLSIITCVSVYFLNPIIHNWFERFSNSIISSFDPTKMVGIGTIFELQTLNLGIIFSIIILAYNLLPLINLSKK
jgi:hypothetical protein